MRVVSVVFTKGGVGKTTGAANLGGLLTDAGLRVLLLDLNRQLILSIYYAFSRKAVAAAYEYIALALTAPAQIASKTVITGLDLILSNDPANRRHYLTVVFLHWHRCDVVDCPDGAAQRRFCSRLGGGGSTFEGLRGCTGFCVTGVTVAMLLSAK